MEILTAILFASFLSWVAHLLGTVSYHSEQMSFGFSAKSHLLCKTTIINHQSEQGPQRPTNKDIRMGKSLRDTSTRPSGWARFSGTHHQSCQIGQGSRGSTVKALRRGRTSGALTPPSYQMGRGEGVEEGLALALATEKPGLELCWL